LSFKYLSLANAHSIGSLAPVIVVALSAIMLKEKVSAKTWIAIFYWLCWSFDYSKTYLINF
jgi:drug/metabolite transporter (DMT)-like permease